MFGSGDGGLGFWLAMYRHEDDMDKVREIRAAANERSLADYYLVQYNSLVRRYNALYDAVRDAAPKVGELEQRVQAQEQELRAKDARIAELEEKLKNSQSAEQYLRDRAWAQTLARLDELREKDRQQNPRSQQT